MLWPEPVQEVAAGQDSSPGPPEEEQGIPSPGGVVERVFPAQLALPVSEERFREMESKLALGLHAVS